MRSGKEGAMRPTRLNGMAGIGVDRMGAVADAAGPAGKAILRFENLDTDLRPPPVALAEARRLIDADEANSYLPFVGQDRLRAAVARHVARHAGVAVDWRTQVLISAGGLSGILNVLLTVLETGDEVVLTDPTYVGLINRVRLAGGVPRLVPLRRERGEWRLDLEALRRSVSPRTRAFLIMSPSMPSGAVLNEAEWGAVGEAVRASGAWLIYDAAMERILFDGRRLIHPASLPGLAERTITVGSASKELRMIGWRVGWIVAPAALVPDLALVSMANVVVPVGIAQDAVAAALEAPDEDVHAAVAEWQRRRDVIVEELDGLPLTPAGGGWSMLLDAAALGLDGESASKRLLERGQIAATAMTGWGEMNGAGFLRFVFSNEPVERLRGMGARVRKALTT
jgi:N-succinyldiaminopimelate aminotransferase